MNEFYRYLSDDLGEAIDYFESPHDAAKEICVALSVIDGPIYETFFRMYTEHLNIDQDILRNAVSYFMGMEKITIPCDCFEDAYLCDIASLSDSIFYEVGKIARMTGNEAFCQVGEQIASILVDLKG